MKRLVIYFGILTLILVGTERLCLAANVNVSDAVGLQAALTAAENNGEPDTINLLAGNYFTSAVGFSFDYTAAAGENQPLTLLGAGVDQTIIDGQTTGAPLLRIDTNTNNIGTDGNAAVLVQGIGFINGPKFGIQFNSDLADLSLTQNKFQDIYLGLWSTINLSGSLNVESNQFEGNSFGISITQGGPLTVKDNHFLDIEFQALAALGQNGANISGNMVMGNPAGTTPAMSLNIVGDSLIDGNTILNQQNSMGDGGGLAALVTGSVVMTNNIFSGNASSDVGGSDGGGVFLAIDGAGPLTLTNNTIVNNSATGVGGGLALDINDPMIVTNLYNNIVFGNTAPPGQGADIVVGDSDDPVNGSPVNLFNNDFTEFLSACQSVTPGCMPDIMGLVPDTNIHSDPLLIDPAMGDFNLGLGSLAIGAGDPGAPNLPAMDLVGNPLNNPPDLGALAALIGLVADPTSFDFGQLAITQESSQEFTITNTGVGTLKVTKTELSDTTNYLIDFGTCGGNGVFELPPGVSCKLFVIFNPQSGGTFDAALVFTSNDTGFPLFAIPLTGIGVGPSGCALNAVAGSFTSMGGFLLLGISLLGMKLWRRRL